MRKALAPLEVTKCRLNKSLPTPVILLKEEEWEEVVEDTEAVHG